MAETMFGCQRDYPVQQRGVEADTGLQRVPVPQYGWADQRGFFGVSGNNGQKQQYGRERGGSSHSALEQIVELRAWVVRPA